MPRIDFSKIEDAQNFIPLPEGDYRCRISDVEESSTQRGDDMWKLTLEVTAGAHKGRRVFDNLVFSDRALRRVKHVCAQLGIDVSGEATLTPAMLEGRECVVEVTVENYEDETGTTKKHNRIPFTGYKSVGPSPGDLAGDDSGEASPF